ncbi:MAG: hypothetical protein WAM66_04030 [Acidobacteriaceae bacterium]
MALAKSGSAAVLGAVGLEEAAGFLELDSDLAASAARDVEGAMIGGDKGHEFGGEDG